MKKRPLLLWVLALLLLASCAPKPPVVTPAPTPTATVPPAPTGTNAPVPDRLVWQDQVFEKTYTADDGTAVMTVRYVLPDVVAAVANPVWSAIHDYYAAEGHDALTAATENADLAQGDYDVTKSLGYDFTPYAEESYYSITLQTAALVSFRRSGYLQTGGAYPTTYQYAERFDLTSGEALQFSGFFSDVPAAKARILDAVRAQIALRPDADTFHLDQVDSSFSEENFYLTADSFVFFFQDGDLAPHAVGIPEFPVPNSELKDLLLR